MTAHAEHLLYHLRRLTPRSSADLPSDAALLERFVRRGDEDAFATLVGRHGPMVHGVCRRVLRDAHAAEDAAQAVFVVLARKADAIRRPDALASWLHRTAHRLALLSLRAETRRRRREDRRFAASETPPRPDPLEELTVRELLRIVDEELRRLPEVYRLPVILCCLEGRTQSEAARQLGWTPGSVKGRLERGRVRLQRRLRRRGLAPAALLALEASRDVLSAALPARLHPAALRTTVLDGPIAPGVHALAEAGVRGMAAAKAKIVGVLLVAAGTLAVGIGTLAHPGLIARQPQTASSAQPKGEAKRTRPPKEKPQVRTDHYGDPLPPGAIARLGTIRLRPGNLVHLLAILPDRKSILSVATEDEAMIVSVWQMATGERLRRFEAPMRILRSVDLSPDGKTLVTTGFNRQDGVYRVLFWDVGSGRTSGELTGIGRVSALAFAPDGKTLATAGQDQTLRLWDAKTGTELRRCQNVKDIWRLAFSPDGKVLASAELSKRTVRLWDPATLREMRAIDDNPGTMQEIAFGPDGKTLATAAHDDKAVRLWDRSTGEEVRKLQIDIGAGISTLAFSPDGKVLAAGSERLEGKFLTPSPIYLWDVNTGRALRRLPGHLFGVNALAFSADGKKLVSGSGGSVLHVWDVGTGKDLLPFAEHESYVFSIAFSPDGRSLATGGLDGTIRLWEPASGKPARIFEEGHRQRVWSVTFAPDGRTLVSYGHDGSLRFCDVSSGRQTRRLQAGKDRTHSAFASSPDGRTLAVWCKDAPIRLLDAATGEERRRLTDVARYPGTLRFSPDGRKLVSMSAAQPGGTGSLQLWDTATGRETRRWTLAQPGPVAFSPDGRTLAGVDAEFLPAGVERRTIHQRDAATGEDRPFAVHQPARVFSLAYSPDGRMLAWGDTAGTTTLWDLAAGQVRRRLKGHHSYVESLAFSSDGKALASGSADTTVLLWDATGRPAAAPPGPLAATRLPALWDDLASRDAGRAFDAIGLLTASPEQAVAMLKDKLHPALAPADRTHLARRIADLDSDQFAVRRKAAEELQQLGERAEPALREALQGKLTLEARKRVEELLEALSDVRASPQKLRELRAVEVLEHAGSPDARRVLQTLAKGAAEARLTREAKASLERLARRSSAKP